MAKKSYKHTELGNKKCIKCGRRLKRRIEEEKPTADKCYRCFKGLPPIKEGENE